MTNVEVSDFEKDVENGPSLGMIFDSDIDAYNFYNLYGGRMGFSIRKDYAHWNRERTKITSRRFVCSKEGVKRMGKTAPKPHLDITHTRTNCPARMGISIMDNGKYQCHDFTEEHNHPLHTPATIHMMRSQRKISDAQAYQIDLADDTGLRPKAIFDFMGKQAGGRECLGHTRQDQKNYLRTKRQRDLAYGEASSLLKYFVNQNRENPSFIYSMQLDSLEQITNVFWADARMVIDYALFGDVVVFDTTFGTNKESRPFGVFTGMNHHRGVVIFGATLLYDETADSFKWLFETFLETHGHKNPITIFTDQDAAMAKAIREVFTGTHHGLCTWHISQNAMKHLGHLMRDGCRFMRDFNACMYGYSDEAEFESEWDKLITGYQLSDGDAAWLARTYELRHKWAKCYMKKTFNLGIRSTQLSESLNGSLKNYLRSSHDIPQFFMHFERMVNDKRYNELMAEYDARDKTTRPEQHNHPLLRQAAEVYTPAIFKKFHKQFNFVGDCYITSSDEIGDCCEYTVVNPTVKEEFNVIFTPSETMITCGCMKFETYGILCCHALKILDRLDIKYIHAPYVLMRWTRAARNFVVEDNQGRIVKEDEQLDFTERYRLLCPFFVKIAAEASASPEGHKLAQNAGLELVKQLRDLHINHPNPGVSTESPIEEIPKGLKKKEKCKGGKRGKSWYESLKGTKKKTKTPKAHSQGDHQGQPSGTSYPVQHMGSTCHTTPSMLSSEGGHHGQPYETSYLGHSGRRYECQNVQNISTLTVPPTGPPCYTQPSIFYSHGGHQGQPSLTSFPVQSNPFVGWQNAQENNTFMLPPMGPACYTQCSTFSSQGSTSSKHYTQGEE